MKIGDVVKLINVGGPYNNRHGIIIDKRHIREVSITKNCGYRLDILIAGRVLNNLPSRYAKVVYE